MKKGIYRAALAAIMALSLAACAAPGTGGSSGAKVYENGGVRLPIPAEYDALLLVEAPENDADGLLFNVSEKASVEAGKAAGHDESWGDGWLFGVGVVDEAALHEMLCYDMSNAAVFATDGDGAYYMHYHPSDVRFFRDDDFAYGDPDNADWAQWTTLCEKAWVGTDAFLAENAGLAPFTRGNSMLDMYLAQAAYLDGANYTLDAAARGALAPNGVDAAPYAERLMSGNGVVYEDAELSETPEGEYIALSFPDDGMRFDFFLAAGAENYVRIVWLDGYEELMKISFPDDTTASAVVQAWYDALAA